MVERSESGLKKLEQGLDTKRRTFLLAGGTWSPRRELGQEGPDLTPFHGLPGAVCGKQTVGGLD